MDGTLGYEGKRVIVTGAASGIGEATARLVHELGAEVHALDVNPMKVPIRFVETDLRDAGSIDRAVQEVGGPIDALFNCAGMGSASPAFDILLCNFCGTRHLIDQVVPLMPAESAIATVSSTAGVDWRDAVSTLRPLVATTSFEDAKRWCELHHPEIDFPYGFSKRAITLATVLMAPTLVTQRLRINTVSPGATVSGLWDRFVARTDPDVVEAALGVAGRASAPDEQALPLLFLNSPAASYINGVDLVVDGGNHAAKLARVIAA
jgi:NAD(P)-dependent dehydrogenase (short-subunit alcohol dehydrogenase family)